MEEIVWIAIGIIAVLITLGILAGFFATKNKEDKVIYAEQTNYALTDMCQKVCRMPDETYLSVNVEIPSGSMLKANDTSICMMIGDEIFCGDCGCKVNSYVLDLTSQEALKLFKLHDYKCFFLNRMSTISVECKG